MAIPDNKALTSRISKRLANFKLSHSVLQKLAGD